MLIIIPVRIIPAVFLSFVFIFVGMGTGGVASALLSDPSQMELQFFVCLPAFVLMLLYLRKVWRDRDDPDTLSHVTALSPAVLVVLLGFCLLVGVGTGAMLGWNQTGHVTVAGVRPTLAQPVDTRRSYKGENLSFDYPGEY